jgi:hypothetical protein
MNTELHRPPGESIEGQRAEDDPVLRCSVVDADGEDLGKVETAWLDTATGAVEFIGVMTGWISPKVAAVPLAQAGLDLDDCVIRLPYTMDLIKEAPRFAQHGTLTEDGKAAIYRHFKAPGPRLRGVPRQ